MNIRKLDTFYLKIIAMITMVIDQVGFLLLPSLPILRIIGRISFPIFAFLAAESMQYGSNKKRYICTLFILDIIMALVAYIATGVYFDTIFITLGLASLTIYLLQDKKIYIKLLAIFPLFIAYLGSTNLVPFRVQYGLYGVLLPVLFYLIRMFIEKYMLNKCNSLNLDFDSYKNSSEFYRLYNIGCAILVLGVSLIVYYGNSFFSTYLPNNGLNYIIQSNAILAIPFILLYSGKLGFSNKAFKISCYLFYPIHIILIYGIYILFF